MNDMSDDKCPIPAPKLLAVESVVVRCSCGAWIERFPAYLDGDGYEECPRECGHTSVVVTRGRPYGPKSRLWTTVVNEFNALWELCPEGFRLVSKDVTTDPPLSEIDWGVIDAWNRRNGVYSMHIVFEWDEP